MPTTFKVWARYKTLQGSPEFSSSFVWATLFAFGFQPLVILRYAIFFRRQDQDAEPKRSLIGYRNPPPEDKSMSTCMKCVTFCTTRFWQLTGFKTWLRVIVMSLVNSFPARDGDSTATATRGVHPQSIKAMLVFSLFDFIANRCL